VVHCDNEDDLDALKVTSDTSYHKPFSLNETYSTSSSLENTSTGVVNSIHPEFHMEFPSRVATTTLTTMDGDKNVGGDANENTVSSMTGSALVPNSVLTTGATQVPYQPFLSFVPCPVVNSKTMASTHVKQPNTFPDPSLSSDPSPTPTPPTKWNPFEVKGANYKDASTLKDPEPDNTRCRGGVIEPFPEKLHRMLTLVEQQDLEHIVHFFSHGRAFIISDSKQFVDEIMPRFFRQSRLTSFQRQLNLYGFKRITQGPDNGGYYHEYFLRGRPALCANMRRKKVKGEKKLRRDPDEQEPNFYDMPPIVGDDQHPSKRKKSDGDKSVSDVPIRNRKNKSVQEKNSQSTVPASSAPSVTSPVYSSSMPTVISPSTPAQPVGNNGRMNMIMPQDQPFAMANPTFIQAYPCYMPNIMSQATPVPITQNYMPRPNDSIQQIPQQQQMNGSIVSPVIRTVHSVTNMMQNGNVMCPYPFMNAPSLPMTGGNREVTNSSVATSQSVQPQPSSNLTNINGSLSISEEERHGNNFMNQQTAPPAPRVKETTCFTNTFSDHPLSPINHHFGTSDSRTRARSLSVGGPYTDIVNNLPTSFAIDYDQQDHILDGISSQHDSFLDVSTVTTESTQPTYYNDTAYYDGNNNIGAGMQ